MFKISKVPACTFITSGFKTKKAALLELKKRNVPNTKFKNETELKDYLKSISKLPVLPSAPRPSKSKPSAPTKSKPSPEKKQTVKFYGKKKQPRGEIRREVPKASPLVGLDLSNLFRDTIPKSYVALRQSTLPETKSKQKIDVDDIIKRYGEFIDVLDDSIKLLYKKNSMKLLKGVKTREEAVKIAEGYRKKIKDKLIEDNNKLTDDVNPLVKKMDADSDEYKKLRPFIADVNKKQRQWLNADKRYINDMIKLITKSYPA